MRVNEYGHIRNTASARKKSAAGATNGNFSDLLSLSGGEEASAAGAAGEAAPLSSLSGMLSLQEVPDGEIARRQAVRQGHSLLDALEQIRFSLLAGRLPLDVLRTLESRLAQQRALTADPALHALMEDIELRAAVELAKIDYALAAQAKKDGDVV